MVILKERSVLHWEEGNDGKGILLTGDIIQVVADERWVSFMYSYPNLIPLPARKVEEMVNRVKPLQFNRLYNAFHRVVKRMQMRQWNVLLKDILRR